MPQTSSPSVGRRHTLRTIILTVLAMLAVGLTLMFAIGWYSSSANSRSFASQGAGLSSSYGLAKSSIAFENEVASDAMSPSTAPQAISSPVPPIEMTGATAAERQQVSPKVIRNGSLTIRVDDAEKRLDETKKLAGQFGGFVANSNLQNNAGTKTAYLTLRVPSDKFDELIAATKKLATIVLSESSNADDVTDQFVDLSARLKAAQAEEAQYLEIMKQAKSVEDTLKVTESLGQVRARIEQLQGQLRYLGDKTDYATLNVTLTEETRVELPTTTWKPLETMRQAFRGLILALEGLVDFLIAAVIYGIGYLLPLCLILWAAYLLVRWLIRKLKRK